MSRVVKSFQVNLGKPYQFSQPQLDSEGMTLKSQKTEPSIQITPEKQASQILENANKQAEQIINNARQTASQILDQARKEIDDMRAMILEKAKAQGYNEGYAEVNAKAESVLQEAEEIRKKAEQEYQLLMHGAEKQIIQIVLDIAKKVIGDELSTRNDRVSPLVVQAIKECSGTTSVVVKIAPEDYNAVNANIEHVMKKSGYSGEIEIKKDPVLSSGECIVETPVGNIDAGFKIQMQAIERAFYDVLTNNTWKE